MTIQKNNLINLVHLGNSYFDAGHFSEACECFRKAIDIDSHHIESINKLGIIAFCQKNWDSAYFFFQHALRIEPDNITSLFYISHCLKALGRNADVGNVLQRLSELSVNHGGPGNRCAPYKAKEKAVFSHCEKSLNIAVFSYDDTLRACPYLRIVKPFQYLNHTIDWGVEVIDRRAIVYEEVLEKADIIIIQRAFPSELTQAALDKIFCSGKTVVYEIDDLLIAPPPTHPYHHDLIKNKPYMIEVMKRAGAVTVSTEPLKKILGRYNPNIFVMPNFIDEEQWRTSIQKESQQLVIGFAGTMTHENDLKLIEEPLDRIAKTYMNNVSFLSIGCTTSKLEKLPNHETVEFDNSYLDFIHNFKKLKIDIGLAPLQNTLFNQCKSNIKWLEYSAAGIAGVYSDLDPYNTCIENGKTGLLAANNCDAWFNAINDLIQNREMRLQIAKNAQEKVRSDYSFQKNAQLWHAFLQTLINDTKAKSPQNCGQQKPSGSYAHLKRTNKPFSDFSFIVHGNNHRNFEALKKKIQDGFPKSTEVIYISGAKSIAESYHRIGQQANGNIIVFCRDDIEILNSDLDQILSEDLKTNDIVGVCGTSRLVSANWISAGHPYIHGQIAWKGTDPKSPFHLSVYGLDRDPVRVRNIQALDGVFFAVKKSVFSDLSFDQQMMQDSRLCGLDFSYRAYLRGFKLSVDHRIMLLIPSDDESTRQVGAWDRPFIKKHLQTIKELDAQNEKMLQQTGENIEPLVKTIKAASKTALKQLMAGYGAGKRLQLQHEGAELEGFDHVAIKETGFNPILAYPDGSLSYLCIDDVKFMHDAKIDWMNEFYRVCAQGSVLELKMQWDCGMGADHEMLWNYHDFFCFDINRPGYCRAAKENGFVGAFLLQSISSHINGRQRQLKAIYQVIKHPKNIQWIEANHSIQKRESVIGHTSIDPMGPAPRFSIIVPHYQGTIAHEKFLRGIGSILNQTCQDFEILCYHDGPLLNPHLDFPIQLFPTRERYNDWGHSLRDIGIHEAKGDYIVHFNPDNLLFPYALEQLSKGGKDILIFPVIMYGLERDGDLVFQHKDRHRHTKTVLTGNPVVYGNIDCMQFVMKREIWRECGGWFDKRGNSDGFMYPFFAERYEAEFIGDVPLGEHW